MQVYILWVYQLEQAKTEEEKNILYKDIKSNLEKINNHGLRAYKIAKGMLQNSRSKTVEKSTFNIDTLCDEVCNLVYTNTEIKVESEKDSFTEFSIILPV